MPKTVLVELQNILKDLQSQTPDIIASMIVRFDGLSIASNVPDTVDRSLLGALTAAAMGISKRVVEQLGQGEMKKTLIEGEEGQLILYGMKNAVLSLLLRKNANLGLIFLLLEQAAEKISKWL